MHQMHRMQMIFFADAQLTPDASSAGLKHSGQRQLSCGWFSPFQRPSSYTGVPVNRRASGPGFQSPLVVSPPCLLLPCDGWAFGSKTTSRRYRTSLADWPLPVLPPPPLKTSHELARASIRGPAATSPRPSFGPYCCMAPAFSHPRQDASKRWRCSGAELHDG